MAHTRRTFLKTTGAAGVVLASTDYVADLLAASPQGAVLQSTFKGLADLALGEAKRLGTTYTDIRFTRTVALGNHSATAANGTADPSQFAGAQANSIAIGGAARGGGGGRGGGRGGGGGFGGFGPADPPTGAGGFGVRVIHSGVWGFASSPIVTDEEIRRITRLAVEIAKASAVAKKVDVQLAPVEAYQVNWSTPLTKDPRSMSDADKNGAMQAVVDRVMQNKGVLNVTASVGITHEWKYLATSEGSYIEQEVMTTNPSLSVSAEKNGVVRTRTLEGPMGTGGWELVEQAKMLEQAEQLAADAVEFAGAPAITPGVRDLILAPSHLSLTLHEIVSHATELDRVMGYEANYAGTSFVKLSDVGKLKYGSKLFNITADKTRRHGNATIGYDDDGVKTTEFPIVRDGILVGLQSNRESAHYIGDKASRGCTQATSWREYPFLRMCNVHLDADPKGPTPEEMIADTKDGVLIEGTGSFSIDQQRYNGQFGGNAFWEIKNGKKTRMVTNVTYNAITTDFWGSLDAVSGPSSWRQFGLTGDAKGQPVQSQRVSHGSSWCRIRKIMVGGAFQ